MTKNKNLALVGAGYWGKNLARNFNQLGALHTLCDGNPSTLAQFGQEYDGVAKTVDFESTLQCDEIERVAIAAPAALHYKLAKQALLAQKDVYVEKPLCLDVNEAEELIALSKEGERVLMVGHLLHYHPHIVKLKDLVATGELGRLNYITSNRLNLGKIRTEENALWSFAPHDLSVIIALAGNQMPVEVSTKGSAYLTKKVADWTLTQLAFSSELRAHVYVSWLNPYKEQKLTIVGDKAMAVFDDTKEWDEKLSIYRDYLSWENGNTPRPNKPDPDYVEVEKKEPLREECIHFIDACDERSTPLTDGAEGLRVLKLLRTAQSSMENNGQTIALEPSSSSSQYYVHPSATVDADAVIGSGSKIWHYTHISKKAALGSNCSLGQNCFVAPNVVIGSNVKVQNNVSIYEGTTVEDDVFLGPSCVLTNVSNPRSQVNRQSLYEPTLLKRGATIGANATIICGTTIGRYAFIAAGAVVTKDVPDYALMMGSPARQQGWMSRHGHVLKESSSEGTMTCPESGLRYQQGQDGVLSCLDLDEDRSLPNALSKGELSYGRYK